MCRTEVQEFSDVIPDYFTIVKLEVRRHLQLKLLKVILRLKVVCSYLYSLSDFSLCVWQLASIIGLLII